MRSFTLLLLLLSIPLFAFSQILEDQSLQDSEGISPIPKSELIGLDVNQLIELGYGNEASIHPGQHSGSQLATNREDCFDAYIPVDQSTYTPVPRNDDGSLFIGDIGFTFSFCGADYTSLYINTNGNLSFGNPVQQYSPDGFPIATPMVAPFWADVDTRNTGCGQAWYRLFGNYMIVSWEEVGWYNQNCSPVNTFQVIISDGTAGIIGVGNNIQFRYGDMEWTTGQASGGGPFGGFPATVGYNSGDNVNFEQVGRFNQDNSNYDGPFDLDDGVHWLDFKCFVFNAAGGAFSLECNDITRSLDNNCQVSITVDDVANAITDGCANVDLSIDVTTFGCNNIGPNTVTITATSGNETQTCTAIVDITNGLCAAPSINPAGPFCESDDPVTLTANPPGGTWGGAAPGGVFDPEIAGPGPHLVTYSSPTSCPNQTDITLFVNANPSVMISPDPAEFCAGDGGVPLTATGTGGDGNYTFSWTTPLGPQSGNLIAATFPGLYTVTITDGNGCSSEEFVNVVENPSPDVIIFDPGPICSSEAAVQLIGSPTGGTWSGPYVTPEGFIFPPNIPPGIFQVSYTYTNNFGCSASATQDIEIVIGPDALAFNDGPYCAGEVISLFGDTNAPGVPSFTWSGPNGYTSFEQSPNNATEPGVYTLVVSINGCESEEAITVVEVTATPDAQAFNNGPYCDGAEIDLFGNTTTSGSNIIYEWSGPAGYSSNLQNPTDATEEGVYVLVVTVDGCPSDPVTTLVEFSAAPDANAQNTGPYCEGDIIILSGNTSSSGTSITYSWTGPSGYSSNQQNPGDATQSGTYNLQISVDGCLSELATTEVVINPPAQPAITGDDMLCEGNSSELDAGGGFSTYDWSNGSDTQVITVDATGTYIVTVTDNNGCTGETQISVTVNPNPDPVITGDDAFCLGESASLDAGNGYDLYNWSEGSNTQTIDVTSGDTYSVTVTDANGCTGETDFVVTENAATTPNITGTLEFCEGDNSVLDAGPGYNTYLWSEGSPDQSITVTTSGTYSVTVTDTEGCTAEDEVDITVNTNPEPSISGDDEFCEGAMSTLDAGNAYDTYIWSDGSGNQTLDVSVSGTYIVTVTDANGCTGTDDINITVNDNPEPTIAGSTTFCTGFSTTLDAGTGYSTYSWSNSTNNQTIEVSTGGTYSVTVTDANGCTGEALQDVEESNSLNPVISGDLDYCVGNSTTLDAGAGFASYEWSDGSIDQTISVNSPDDYTVTVSDANGCTGETTVSVIENNLPTINITGNDPFCSGQNITLDAGAGFDEYAWSNTSLNQTIDINMGGEYTVTVTDANGCSNEATVTAVENANPSPTITGDQAFCAGQSVTLDAGNYDEYVWSNTSTTQTTDISTGGTYSVTVTDNNGCTGEDQFTVTENQLPQPEITGTLDFCEGSSTTLSGPDGFDYEWSTSETSQEISVGTGGAISLIVTDANGCTGETSVAVVENPNPSPTITGSTSFCIGTSTTIDAGAGYSAYVWSNNTLNQTVTITVEGDYTVTVTDSNGCTGEASITITESESLEPVIAGDDNICEGENSILDAGAGFETYSWSTGDVNQSITVTTPGDYSVTVSDLQGCTGETTLTLVVNQNPVASISGVDSFCEGDNSTLNAGAGYSTYEWSTGAMTQTIDVTTSDTYSVLVTDANGCQDQAEIEIIVNPNPEPVILGPNSFCSGNSATLDAGAGYDTYQWSNGDNTQTITVQDGNLYSVTVTSTEGCTGETELEVTETPSLTPQIAGTLNFCEGDNTILDAGNGFETYEWSTGETSQTITVSGDGNYSVLVTDADGCSGTDNVIVSTFQNPEPIIAGSSTFCIGSFTTLDVGAYDSYQWSNGDNTQTITVDMPGDYTVNVIDENGCAGSATISVTESTSLNPVIGGLPVFCVGSSTTLDAGAGFDSYNWSDGSSNQTLEVTAVGDYGVTVSDAQGCTGETQVSVTEEQLNAGTAEAPLPFCADESEIVSLGTLLTGADPSGNWIEVSMNPSQGAAFNATNGSFDMTNQNAGTYQFEYIVSNGVACPDVSEVVTVIVNELPTVNAGVNIELSCTDPILSLDANGSSTGPQFELEWTGGVLMDGNEDTPTPTVDQPGFYTLTITNTTTGCSASDVVEVTQSADVPLAIAGDDAELTCAETEYTLQASGDTGTGFEIEWQGPAINAGNINDPNPVIDQAGIYILTITNTDNGCISAPDTVIISNNDTAPVVVIETPLSIDCNNPSIEIIGTSPNSNVSFEWFDGNTPLGSNPTVDGIIEPGIYTLVVTDNQNGCVGTETVEVFQNNTPPSAVAGLGQTITCFEPEVTLDGSGSQGGSEIVYNWSGPGVTSDPSNNTISANVPGVYIISVLNNDNGCISFDTVSVDQNTVPPTANIQTPDEFDCTTNEVSLDGAGSSNGSIFTYTWIDAQGNILSNDITAQAQDLGVYFLAVQNTDNGCVDTTSVTVVSNDNVPYSALFNINQPDCSIDDNGAIVFTEVLGGTAPYVYSINGAPYDVDGFYTSLDPGNYELALEDANGCTWDTTITIIPPPVVDIDLGTDLQLEMGDSAIINAVINIPFELVDTLVWSPRDLLDCGDPDCLEVGFSSFESQTLTATLIDIFGCSDTDEISVYINRDRRVFIPNAFTPNGDGENDRFIIHADQEQVAKINKFLVFNRWGEIVYEGLNFQPNDPDFGWDGTLKGELMNPSVFVYLAEIEFIDGQVELYKGDVTLIR